MCDFLDRLRSITLHRESRRPPADYISTILKPATWGGAIELGILAAHYKTEICSIDVETGRVDHFPAGPHGSGMRCILIYSGIHYDAATLAPVLEAPNEWHQTVFPVVNFFFEFRLQIAKIPVI